jgi:hypothetical protein
MKWKYDEPPHDGRWLMHVSDDRGAGYLACWYEDTDGVLGWHDGDGCPHEDGTRFWLAGWIEMPRSFLPLVEGKAIFGEKDKPD